MADSPRRDNSRNQQRRAPPRGASPSSSQSNAVRGQRTDPGGQPSSYASVTSDFRDEPLMPPPSGLRAMESRFSLNEQFATSKREFEFEDDDTASILEPLSLHKSTDTSSDGTVGEDNHVDWVSTEGNVLESLPSRNTLQPGAPHLYQEEKAAEPYLANHGTCKIFLNASHIITNSPSKYRWQVGLGPDRIYDSFHGLKISSVIVDSVQFRQSLIVPLPATNANDKSSSINTKSIVPTLSLTGSFGAHIQESVALMVDPGWPASIPLPPPSHWYSLISDRFQLSSCLRGSILDDGHQNAVTTLSRTDYELTAGVFPSRGLSIGLGRPVILARGTRPFHVFAWSHFSQPLSIKPPDLRVRISRSLGKNQLGYLQGSSGDYEWTAILGKRLGSLPWLPDSRVLPTTRIGYAWVDNGSAEISSPLKEISPDRGPTAFGVDLFEEKAWLGHEFWHIASDSSPFNAAVSATYGRNFSPDIAQVEMSLRSRGITEEDKKTRDYLNTIFNGVRLEVEADLALHSSFGGAVRFLRRVSNSTSVGVGVGLNHQHGLYISVSLCRFGQSIILPITLLSKDHVNVKLWLLAVAIPWFTYIATDVAFLRPWYWQRKMKAARSR